MSWILTNALAAILLPPLSLFLLGGAGWLLLKLRDPVLGKTLLLTALALLWIFSTPFFSFQLITQLEAQTPASQNCKPQAIVVLGAGTYFNAPEYGGDTITPLGLERLRLAVHLHRQTHLPILLTGGQPDGGKTPEAVLMQSELATDFNIQAKWIEIASANTRENAFFSHRILQANGIGDIYLVSQAWHMPRAQAVFAKAGFCVTPASTGYRTRNRISLLSFIPDSNALAESRIALHEIIGIARYRLSA